MSFFDEDDEPTRRPPRARRTAPAAGRPARTTSQDIMVRRIVAAVAGVVVLILLVVVVNACQTSARKNALRAWNSGAQTIVTASDTEVGDRFFETIRQQNQQPEDLQSSISGLRATADRNLERAEDLDVPDELRQAQTAMLIALEMRRETLQYVATRIQTAVGSEGDAADRAIEGIAANMQGLLASDAIMRLRVTPLTREALEDDDVVADPVSTAGFLENQDWLQPAYAAEQIGTSLTGTEARERNEPIAPGLHGNGLDSTTFNGIALQPDDAANEVTLGDGAVFEVAISNSGENTETNVRIKVTLEGTSGEIVGRGEVDVINAGESATAEVTLPEEPTAGEIYTIRTEVVPVPGEEKTDNNSSEYQVFIN